MGPKQAKSFCCSLGHNKKTFLWPSWPYVGPPDVCGAKHQMGEKSFPPCSPPLNVHVLGNIIGFVTIE